MNHHRKTGKSGTVWLTVRMGIAVAISAGCIAPAILVNLSVRGGDDADLGHLLLCIASVVFAAIAGIGRQKATASGDMGMARCALVLFIVLMLFNLTNAVGLSGAMRDGLTAPRKAQNAIVTIRKKQLSELSERRQQLSRQVGPDTAGMIRSAIRKRQLSEPKIWKRTNHCGSGLKDVERQDSAKFCFELSELERRLAAIEKYDDLTRQIAVINNKLAEVGVDTSIVDPHSQTLTALVGLFVDLSEGKSVWVGIGLDLLFGLVIEIIAGLAPAMIFYMLVPEMNRPGAKATGKRSIAKTKDAGPHHVEVFIAECVVPMRGSRLQGAFLFQRYVAWCIKNEIKALTNTGFGRKLKALGYKKERSGLVYYIGIAFASEGLRLAVDNGQSVIYRLALSINACLTRISSCAKPVRYMLIRR